jgi:hypothetical protein
MATKTAVAVRKRTPAKPKKLTSADVNNLQVNKQKPGYPALAVIEELSSARTAKDKAKAVDKLFSKIRESLLTGNGTLIVERIAEPQYAPDLPIQSGQYHADPPQIGLSKASTVVKAPKQVTIFELMTQIDGIVACIANQCTQINDRVAGGVPEALQQATVSGGPQNVSWFLQDLRDRVAQIQERNARTIETLLDCS